MNMLAAIRREERKLEKQVSKLQHRLGSMRAAAKSLFNDLSAGRGYGLE
jgi:ribosome-associated translation inhibitor RaiA